MSSRRVCLGKVRTSNQKVEVRRRRKRDSPGALHRPIQPYGPMGYEVQVVKVRRNTLSYLGDLGIPERRSFWVQIALSLNSVVKIAPAKVPVHF